MNSRDIRNYATSAITAMLPANENADTNDILKRLIFDFEAVAKTSKPKIAIILTNGNTENQDDFEANAKKMQDLGVVVIPIALSRKCRYVIESSMMSQSGKWGVVLEMTSLLRHHYVVYFKMNLELLRIAQSKFRDIL